MLTALLIKEFQLSLRSTRFVIALAVVLLGFMISGIVGTASYQNQWSEYSQRKAEADGELLGLMDEGLNEVAFAEQPLLLPPSSYTYIRDLSGTRLPEQMPVNVVRHEDMEKALRSNPILYMTDSFSWQFIVTVLCGFIALLLSYDAIAEERRQGTISLIFANGLPRWKMITAKLIALTLINAVLVAAGVMLSMLILAIGNVPVLDANAIGTTAVFFLLAVFYLAFITSLGLFVSSLTRIPSIALTALFFVWVTMAIIFPSAARVTANAVRTIPTPDERLRELYSVIGEIIEQGDQTRPVVNGSSVVNYSRIPFGPVEQHVANYTLDVHEAQRRLQEQYDRRIFEQAEYGIALARWSPVELFRDSTAKLTNTGIDRWRGFIADAENYRKELGSAVRALDSTDPESPHVYFADFWVNIWISRRPVEDAAQIPRFSITEPPLDVRTANALQPAVMMLGWTAILYLLTVVLFMRADLRQQTTS